MNRNTFFILIVLATIGCLPASAQRDDGGRLDPRAREKIRAAHAAYITRRLSLTPEEAQAFWPVYNEYDEKRQELREQWRASHRSETDEKTVLERDMKFKQQELDLEREYMQRFEKIVPAEKLIRLRPAEADFRKLVLRQVQKRRRN